MHYYGLPKVLLLAVAYVTSVAAVTYNGHRVLRAATKRADFSKRDTRITQKFQSEVVYIEDNSWNGKETFASSIRVESEKPILNLEEIEHHLEDVRCEDGRMMLHFVDASSAQDARNACHGGHGGMGGMIITSHESCNKDGERAVYKIDDVSYAEEGMSLDLAVTEALWQDAFDNIDINFGYTGYDHIYRRHSDFTRARRKRAENLTIEIPSDTPDNIVEVAFDLTSELLDTTFTADDFLAGFEALAPVPGIAVPDLPVEIGCKNCSTRGQVVLTQGAIKIEPKQIDLIPDIFGGGDDGKNINSIITGGYMDLTVTGMGAHLEMFARPIKSGSYEIRLFPLPVLGFVIPGIGKAGASFEPKITVEFEVDGEIAVNYGVDVAIQDNASIKVELGNLTNTSITGIKGATLNALPFTSDAIDANVLLSLAFLPTIPIGFEFSDKLSALVTVSMSLPRLDAKLTTSADGQCSLLERSDNGKNGKAISKPETPPASPESLMLLEANISVAIDVSADLMLPLLPAPFDTFGTATKIFSTEMPLITSCITPVNGAIKITEMAPIATIAADKVGVKGTCTKPEADKPCMCAMATTTIYAAPATPTTPQIEMTPYYPSAPTEPAEGPQYPTETPPGGYVSGTLPITSTLCTNTETLRITISKPPTSSTETPAAPPIILIPASKPCNSTSPVFSTLISSPSEDGYCHSPSPSTLQSISSLPHSTTPSQATTTPPRVEESMGFMSPPSNTNDTGGVATSTGITEFTGAAVPGKVAMRLERGEVGWQVAVLGMGMAFGALMV